MSGAPFLAESEANSCASDSATLFTGAERETPPQEEAGASQQTQLRQAQGLRVRGYTTGEPVLLKQTTWPGGPVRTENLKSPSPLLGFGKVLSLMPRSSVWQCRAVGPLRAGVLWEVKWH